MTPCPLPLVSLAAHETCPRCGHPAREHRGHPAYEETTMDESSTEGAQPKLTDHDRLALEVGRALLLSRGYDARIYEEEADEVDEAYRLPFGIASTLRTIAEVIRAHSTDGVAR